MCYLLVPMNGTLLFWTRHTLPPLVTPHGPQIFPYSVPMTPRLMHLAILRGQFSIPSSPTSLLKTNMLSTLNPLTLKGSGPILAGSTNTLLKKNFHLTTQWAAASTRYHMRKNFKSRLPAFNIPMLEGVVATRRTSGQTVGPRVCSYVLVTLEVSLARN